MPVVKIHYHDHAETCKKCGKARDQMDPFKHLAGDGDEVMKLHNSSCPFGKEILMAFWMSYGEDD